MKVNRDRKWADVGHDEQLDSIEFVPGVLSDWGMLRDRRGMIETGKLFQRTEVKNSPLMAERKPELAEKRLKWTWGRDKVTEVVRRGLWMGHRWWPLRRMIV